MSNIDSLRIREIKPEEIPGAINCIHAASVSNMQDYPVEFIKYLNEAHYNEDWLRKKTKHHDFFVGLLDGEVVVTGSSVNNEITNIFVNHMFQGQGIGKQMMEYIEKNLSNKFEKVTLNCNITSLSFYQNIGYTLVSEKLEEWQGHQIKSFKMEKTLHW